MGPLAGIKVIELAGIGPGPFCGMMLADMGADVLCVERSTTTAFEHEPLERNRTRIALDLKTPGGRDAVLRLSANADALFEGFRPGVAERLGVGPDACLALNPRLVYGRMTGWGQDGPLARAAGHDINYIALSGALHAIGRAGEKPTPPLNLVGDFGGGGLVLAFGMVCALLETQRSGKGQVVDAAMVDGAIALMAMFIGMQQRGLSCDRVGGHFLSGAAHYYDTYETSDGKYISIAALEPQFYQLLIDKLGLDPQLFASAQMTQRDGQDSATWGRLKEVLATLFKTKTRAEWCELLEGSDVCFAPVLTLSEAPEHPHNRARAAFIEVGGVTQNAPAPRFSRTLTEIPTLSRHSRGDIEALLSRWRVADADRDAVLRAAANG